MILDEASASTQYIHTSHHVLDPPLKQSMTHFSDMSNSRQAQKVDISNRLDPCDCSSDESTILWFREGLLFYSIGAVCKMRTIRFGWILRKVLTSP